MLATINYELQNQHENMAVFDMIEHMKMFYQKSVRNKRFEIFKALFQGKIDEGTPIGPCVLKITSYAENNDLILQSLLERFSQFVLNSI